MGTRGQLPKVAQGDFDRREPVRIEPPTYLPTEVLDEFRRAVGWLANRGADFGPEDEAMLEIYARARVGFREACDRLAEEGLTLVSARGRRQLSPLARYAHQQRTALLDASKRLGLSPADRARLTAPNGGDEPNPLLDKIKRRGAS